jgi:predicted transcriptional regulator
MKITTSITLDEELINQIDFVADIEDRTRSGMIKVIIKDWISIRPGLKEQLNNTSHGDSSRTDKTGV